MTITFKDAAANYLKHLEGLGKSKSTLCTAGNDLALAQEFFGAERELGKILPVHTGTFFKHDSVLKLPKSGKPRSPATVLQIKRVFRMFLVWAHEQGDLERIPLVAEELERARGGRIKKAKPESAANPKKPSKAKGKLVPPASATPEENSTSDPTPVAKPATDAVNEATMPGASE